ncbi:hypothetical protein [Roseibium sp. MB-4]
MAITQQTISQVIGYETGRRADFPSLSLVSNCGEIEVDGTPIKVMMSAPGKYELWHPSGLQMQISFKPVLSALADLLNQQAKAT